ncbi:unnamed protein product [Haemonchus placei]|uniref:RING-type domain-containing protein n=1 Tax=Haemonchus placei TaxID=6290 RepID=A0A158QP05_HAEPC|nr:unnamed protein product [Haemonchus placei]
MPRGFTTVFASFFAKQLAEQPPGNARVMPAFRNDDGLLCNSPPRSVHPLWWTKPGCAEGKRSKRKRLGSKVVPGAALSCIMKTVEDPNNVLSKRGKDRLLSKIPVLCADTFVPDVMYSLEKRNRWKEANPANLLNGVDSDEVSAQVVEAKTPFPENYFKDRAVFGVYELDGDGEMVSKTAGGQGASLSSLTYPQRQKHRQSHRNKRCNVSKEDEKSEAEEVTSGKAQIRYLIMHEKPGYYGRHVRGKADRTLWKTSRARRLCLSDSELTISEVEENEQIDGDDHEPKREKGLNLGDFVTKTAVRRRRGVKDSKFSQSFEMIDLPESDKLKPFDLVDITSVPKGFFEFLYIDTTSWKDFNFIEQVENLKRKRYKVRWLDRNHQRVAIDATNAVDKSGSYDGEPTVFVIIERCFKNNKLGPFLKIHLNSSMSPKKNLDWLTFKYLTKGNWSDIDSAVEGIVRFPQIHREYFEERLDDTLQVAHSNEHLPMFNPKQFIGQTHRISHLHMENMLREQVDADSFENLSMEEVNGDPRGGTNFPSSCSTFDTLPSIPLGVKCCDCGNHRINYLYEMDDCWMCRQCVRQLAVCQIRAGCVPVNLPFIVPSNTTCYDVLPSILPLPLFNFYTKYAAIELIKQSMGNIVLDECPGCKQAVEIFRPNEYNCAECECGIVWCTECKKEPHWPMICETAAEWRTRWKCRKYAECENCQTAFNPQNMYQVPYRGHRYRYGKFPVVKDFILPDIHVPRIKNEVVEICEKARASRFGVAHISELERACRSSEDTGPYVSGCRDIVLTRSVGLGFVAVQSNPKFNCLNES